MEAVVERSNLLKALEQVQRNKGAPGIDGMTIAKLAPYLMEHWPAIRAQLLEGSSRCGASKYRRHRAAQARSDRFIQQAVMRVLQAA